MYTLGLQLLSVCMQVVLYTVSIPKVLTVNNIIMAVFILSLHFKDNTVCVIEHISFNMHG